MMDFSSKFYNSPKKTNTKPLEVAMRQILYDKNLEINILKQNLLQKSEIDKSINEKIKKSDYLIFEKLTLIKEDDKKQLENLFEGLKNENSTQLKDLEYYKLINKDLDETNKLLKKENEILCLNYNQRIMEINELTLLNNEKINEKHSIILNLIDQINELKQKNKEIENLTEIKIDKEIQKFKIIGSNEIEIKYKAEITSLQTEIMQLKQRLEEEKNINFLLNSEKLKNQDYLFQRQSEINEWKNKSYLNNEINDFKYIKELEESKSKIVEMKENLIKINALNMDLKTQINSLNQNLSNKDKELEEALDIIKNLKEQIYQINQEKNNLVFLKETIKDNDFTLMMKVEENTNLITENDRLNNINKELEEKLHKYEQENNKIKKVFSDKIKDINGLQNKYIESMNFIESESRITYSRYSSTKKL